MGAHPPSKAPPARQAGEAQPQGDEGDIRPDREGRPIKLFYRVLESMNSTKLWSTSVIQQGDS